MKTPKTVVSPIQALLFLMAFVLVPLLWWYEQDIEAYFYYRDNCDDRRPHRHLSYDTPVPIGYAVYGIDISHYSCRIDWAAVQRMNVNGVRIQFAYMRATIGTSRTDYLFDYNWTKAREAKMIRGAYHFFRPSEDADSQAQRFLNTVTLERGDLPPVLDIERDKSSKGNETNSDPDRAELLAGVTRWLEIVERQTGVRPILYCNLDYYRRYLMGNFPNHLIWIAAYKTPRVALPDNRVWRLWQFSDKAQVNGIGERVDMNVWNGSALQFQSILHR